MFKGVLVVSERRDSGLQDGKVIEMFQKNIYFTLENSEDGRFFIFIPLKS